MTNLIKESSKKQSLKQNKNDIPVLDRTEILNDLIRGEHLCSYHSKNIRDVVYNARKVGVPIETITCLEESCRMKGRKHKAYYYEWALERRR